MVNSNVMVQLDQKAERASAEIKLVNVESITTEIHGRIRLVGPHLMGQHGMVIPEKRVESMGVQWADTNVRWADVEERKHQLGILCGFHSWFEFVVEAVPNNIEHWPCIQLGIRLTGREGITRAVGSQGSRIEDGGGWREAGRGSWAVDGVVIRKQILIDIGDLDDWVRLG